MEFFFGYFGDWLSRQPLLVQAWTIGQANMQLGSLLQSRVQRSFLWLTKALRFTENYGREQYFNGVNVYFYWQQGRAHLTIGNERFWLNNPDEGPAWEEIERLLAERALLDAE